MAGRGRDAAAGPPIQGLLVLPPIVAGARAGGTGRGARDARDGAILLPPAESLLEPVPAAALLDRPRALYANRFDVVGRLWKEALSKLRLKFSLQMALHAPALFSARLEKRGPLVTEKQFFSLLYFCIEPDETKVAMKDVDRMLLETFECFAVEPGRRADFRDFLCVLSFHRERPDVEVRQLVWNWYRYYDGEVSGGVAGHTLLKLLVTMARSATEAAKLLSLLHWSVVLGGSEDAVVAGGLSPRSRDVRAASRRLSGEDDAAPRADPTRPPRFQMDDPRIEALFTLEEVSDADASLLREMRSAARSVDDLRRSAGLPPLRAALRAATAMGRVDAGPASDAASSSTASFSASPSATSQSVADRFILRPVGEDVFAWRPKRPTIDDSLWVTTAMLRRLLEASPEFLAEMERLRFDLVAPVHRAAVRRRQVEKELSKIEVHVVVIREKLQLARAAAFWTTRSSRKWFTLWVAHVKEKKEVESRMMIQRIRRLLRLWVEASHARRVARSQRKVADLFFMRSREVRAFRAWFAFTSTRLRRRVVYERRANQAYRLSVLENGWEQLFTATIGAKGLRLRRNNLLRFAFRGWKRFLEIAQEMGVTKRQQRLAEERAQQERAFKAADQARLEGEARDRQYALELAVFADEAALRAEEVEELARVSAATHRRREEAALSRQKEAHERVALRTEGRWKREFEEFWARRKVERVEEVARSAEEFVRANPEGVAAVQAVVAKMMVKGATAAEFAVEGSPWHPTGDAAFIHGDTGQRVELGRKGVAAELAEVVIANHVVREVAAEHLQFERDKEEAFLDHYRERAARGVQGLWRSRRMWQVIVSLVRENTEEVFDPYTGSPEFFDVSTRRKLPRRPLLLHGCELRPQPHWLLRIDHATGTRHYQDVKHPWKTMAYPPASIILCHSCQSDFADRRCYGPGCDGMAYCYRCWVGYHPAEDPVWASHLEFVQRMQVRECLCSACGTEPASVQVWDPEVRYEAFCKACFRARELQHRQHWFF